MAAEFFSTLQCVLELIAEDKLKKDIDDTLMEKLLNLIEKSRLQLSDNEEKVIVITDKVDQDSSDFIREMVKRTEALNFIEKTLVSVAQGNKNKSIMIKSFYIRFLGLIFEKSSDIFCYEKLLPLLKNTDGTIVLDHNPSVQDALLFCLSSISKNYGGALWFINQNLKDFVLSSFNSSSYYVRKSSVNFFINFILQWTSYLSVNKQKSLEELKLEAFITNFISFIIESIHFYNNSDEMVFAECCITILKELLETETSEFIIKSGEKFSQNISDCFMELSEDDGFNEKLLRLFLTIHFKFSLPEDGVNNAFKCLVVKENIKLAMDLASSFLNKASTNQSYQNEAKFFLLPVYILLNESLEDCESFFAYSAKDVYCITAKKMEDKSTCKLLFSSSLSALVKIVPRFDFTFRTHVVQKLLEIVKCSNPCHKWLYSVLEDRLVHHSLISFYSSLLSDNVCCSIIHDKTDLIFQNILEYLKKSSTDSNFISQLLLLMKNVLNLHKKYEFEVANNEKNDLIQILCRTLLDSRESVVDSAIHLSGEIIKNDAWQDKICQQTIHSIIWDIAFQGSLDGTTRSTALKTIIEGCQQEWCLKEIKSLKRVTEVDIAEKLFHLTHDPDFFLQREALSCLFSWIKSRWDELPSSCVEYLYVSLVDATNSLDLEFKLISLDVWEWLLENKFKISDILSPFDIKEYINRLTTSGFGLSMILAFKDYDKAVQYKAANILFKLQNMLTTHGISFDSLPVDSAVDDEIDKCILPQILTEPVSKEERDKGIDVVMELSTSEQIANICYPFYNTDDFKDIYCSKKIMCTIAKFWTCLWSENVLLILEPVKDTACDTINAESIFSDIKSARVMECDLIEDIPDCY